MSWKGCHYHLKDGEIARTPQAAGAMAWFREVDGVAFLCVMEGAAFHLYEISGLSVRQVVAQGAAIIWSEGQRAVSGLAMPARFTAIDRRDFKAEARERRRHKIIGALCWATVPLCALLIVAALVWLSWVRR